MVIPLKLCAITAIRGSLIFTIQGVMEPSGHFELYCLIILQCLWYSMFFTYKNNRNSIKMF